MQNVHLVGIQEKLNKFYTYFQDDHVLVITEDKKSLPFAYIIHDKGFEDTLLLSIAVDYPTAYNVASVIFLSLEVYKLTMISPFYISSVSGNKFIGEEAFSKWEIETLELNNIIPSSKYQH